MVMSVTEYDLLLLRLAQRPPGPWRLLWSEPADIHSQARAGTIANRLRRSSRRYGSKPGMVEATSRREGDRMRVYVPDEETAWH